MPESQPLTIRPARASDTEFLGRLGAVMVETHHAMDPRRFLAPTPQTPIGYGRFLASEMANDSGLLLVAEEGGELCGYVYGSMEPTDYMSLRGPCGALQDIVVHPQYQGRGIGRKLLDAIIAALQERGAKQIVLSTAWRNEVAQRLFTGAGFRRTMVEMTRDLDG